MEAQVQNAVEIAWDPRSDPNLKSQAFNFLDDFRASSSAWIVCLSLFTQEPRKPDVLRHVALEVLNNSIKTQQLDVESQVSAKIGLMKHVSEAYTGGPTGSPPDPSNVQNKLAQTLVFLFTQLYESRWESFFEDLWQPAARQLQSGASSSATDFYLRTLVTVHDEIADQLIQTTPENTRLNTELKDLIRTRDAVRIGESWREILACWQQLNPSTVTLCLNSMSRWVKWSDISLVANETSLSYVMQIAEQPSVQDSRSELSRARLVAIDVFTEIVGKKMSPDDKVELLGFLHADEIVGRLSSVPALDSARGTSDYDTDMAEGVAKLVNNCVFDLVNALSNESSSSRSKAAAASLLERFMPYLLRFLSDEYDEVCSTIISALSDQLAFFRKISKAEGHLPHPYNEMIFPILKTLVAKMRYDDTASWSEEDDETDEAEFQELRKRLRVCQQSIAAVDEASYMDTLVGIVESILNDFKKNPNGYDWRDVDLALVEMHLLGELAVKNSGLYQKRLPSSAGSERLIDLMTLMIDSNVASCQHPAIQLQVMEIWARYHSFFEQQTQYLTSVLESFVQFLHSDHMKVRLRAGLLFLRFVQRLRTQLGHVTETIIRAIGDLLYIKAEVSSKDDDDSMSSSQKDQIEDPKFQSQLNLFEAVGQLASVPSVSVENQVLLVRTVLEPMKDDVQRNLADATNGNEWAVLQIHHLIEAMGVMARGFSDWVPGRSSMPVAEQVSDEFQKASSTILHALGVLRGSFRIRSAARFAFTRLIGVLGFKILEQLPQWLEGFLVESSTREEMGLFLRLLDQVVFGFKTQLYGTMDALLSPLLQRVFASFSEPTSGTDDAMELNELRREYLSFLLVLLNNDLEGVLVSSTNQGMFETIMSAIEHFAKDISHPNEVRHAMSVLQRMCSVWGGPNIYTPGPTNDLIASTSSGSPSPAPTLQGFDQFMLTRFSPLTWAIMTKPDLNPTKDSSAGGKILTDVAELQGTLLAKTGREYLVWLRDSELTGLGLGQEAIEWYLNGLCTKSGDSRAFKGFLVTFLQQIRGG